MRISVKGRYALAAVIHMAQQYNVGKCITVISISEALGISKIYLEQVFSALKKGKIVASTKGAQGGYQLTSTPEEITVLDVLQTVEASLFEQTQETVFEKAPDIEKALQSSVFDVLDKNIKTTLSSITIADLVKDVEKYRLDNVLMFYI
ncbi:MAG: Rrf2 family transcriptional regulator, cysteine metabolism repressor [Epulopiscium sp.]|jgi:Rrf2 family protein|uniref:Rrf2 family transcriptional regulator n=1 Tax=Defluviitalea raffinosedens TaxID=1450156 RepID=A0A7C8HET0_9FIRM|nr:Rrf2 family transcriptional regulator [Defluviitalea raffinosedens]MBZ4667636.1 transcriptional regulator, BadM/Rrf2 family [Defluviitaleaceae bacterium]MDK2787118.1 Rrf2 family transcriptional regulator, cysteine metabolism repressor [Candidatus Epulonipiscium sp.]KAE9634874.1 Rrf2 family transcriptional regulator [Defluviitalea raffinosedens]MBM7685661.1 Rrf2 family protein [Defluviitalea raffinosedens]HHW66507.1 Rrf2 family transcriptional regulator [Candidatus Epulonipiscium sp.]